MFTSIWYPEGVSKRFQYRSGAWRARKSLVRAQPPSAAMALQSSSTPALGTCVRKQPAAARSRDVGEYSPTVPRASAAVAGESSAAVAGEYSRAHAARRVRQRPAAPARYEDLGLQGFPQIKVEEPEWTGMPTDGEDSPSLPWADHLVQSLVSNGHLPSHSQKEIVLQAWSDCSGINAEKFSWNELQDAIRRIIGADVSLELY